MKYYFNLHIILLLLFTTLSSGMCSVSQDFAIYCGLQKSDLNERGGARSRIIAAGQNARPFLLDIIGSGKSIEKQCAAELLGEVGIQQDESVLLQLLASPDPFVSQNARLGLAALYTRMSDKFIHSRINLHTTKKVALMAALYAAYLRGKAAKLPNKEMEIATGRVLLGSTDPEVQIAAAQVLRFSQTTTGLKALLKMASKEQASVQLLCEVCKSLEQIVPAGKSKTIEKLAVRPEPALQLAALGVLGKLNYSGVAEALQILVAHKDPAIRAEAIMKLSQYGSLMNMTDFVQALSDTSADVRLEAVLALGKLGNPAAAIHLRKLMGKDGDKNPVVRAQAALAFSKSGSVGALGALLDDARDRSQENRAYRLEAIRALGELGDTSAVRALTICVEDSDGNVALAALVALCKINSPTLPEILKKTAKSARPALADYARSILADRKVAK